jgi:hypothetical protein
MTSYNGHCHCGNTEFTVKLGEDQQGHVLWYVCLSYFPNPPNPPLLQETCHWWWCWGLVADVRTLHSHCNTCKLLSGSAYTLNQIIPADALNITKGKDLGKYTYKGESGKGVHCVSALYLASTISVPPFPPHPVLAQRAKTNR